MERAWHALAAYFVISVAVTWPLILGLGRDVAWDLGDPVLIMWALAWDCDQILAVLGGDLSRISSFFHGNIFHPAPLTLAYSEHVIAQAVQILPIYAATGNPILCYNLLLLATFVLSGLGMYLFVRELTGSPLAAFVAGLIFAFAPYRFSQLAHLPVLSSQWMPFVLYGIRRYFETRTSRPLIGGGAALVAQNLSCGYYLLYFAPLAAAYALWELVRRGAWRERRVLAQLLTVGAVVAVVTAPFVLPYAAVNSQLQLGRSRGEVVRYSADVYSFATAVAAQPVWGETARAFPKPEGELFPGIAPVLLACIGLVMAVQIRLARERPTRRAIVTAVLCLGAVAHAGAAIAVMLNRRIVLDLWMFELRMSNANQLLVRSLVLAAVALAVSPNLRAGVVRFLRDRGFFVIVLVAAVWLSLGPVPQALGRPVELVGPYRLLYEYVPGFEGIRVPARLMMIVVLSLSVLSGYGAAALASWKRGPIVLGAFAVAALLESVVWPFQVNGMTPPPGLNAPATRLYRPGREPAVYRVLAREPAPSVVVELPLGQPDYDLRAMFYSIVHRHRLLNGYSGFFPPHYDALATALGDVPRHPELAWSALRGSGATHVLVHEAAWLDDQGLSTSAALQREGATELFRDGDDVLLKLP